MRKKVCLIIMGLIMVSPFLLGQATSTSSKIIGKVTDENGNPLPGVTVTAESPKLVGISSTITDDKGIYRLLALQPGEYTLTFTLQGFNTVVRKDIVLHIDETLTVNITMTPGKIEEEITVTGMAPLIDVRSTTKGMTITRQMFEVLPRGRNFDTLVTAVPGVNNEPWLGGISVDGASAAENQVYIDGTDITRNDVGLPRIGAAFEFADEIQVVASGYNAEYGGALGGVINVVTRQGGNEYHGEVIAFYNSHWMRGIGRDTLRLNPYDTTKAEYVNYETGKNLEATVGKLGKDKYMRLEPGFSLGGYILKDRLWFFGSLLPVFIETTGKRVFLTTPKQEGEFTQKYTYYNFSGRITSQPLRFLRVGASFVNNFYKYRGDLPARDGTSSPTAPWDKYGLDYPGYTASAFADFTFGNNVMINLRAGRLFFDTTNQQVKATEPRWIHLGSGTAFYADIPSTYQRPLNWMNYSRLYEYKKYKKYKNNFDASLTYYFDLSGEHALKLGFSWVRQGEDSDMTITYPEVRFYWNRTISIGGVNYGRGTYGYYEVRGSKVTGPFGEYFNVYNDRYALFIQDSWTIADKFTLNLGLRAESEFVPPYSADPSIPPGFRPIEFDWDEKLAPRIGFVYDVFGDASLKIFGHWGLYFDVIKTYMAAHSYAGFKWKSAYYTLDTYEWTKIGINEYWPGELKLVYDWRHPSFETTDPDLKPVSQREISFGAEKKLIENLSLTVRFVQKHLRYTIEDVGILTPYGEVYFETNPGYGYSIKGTAQYPIDPKYWPCPRAKREYYAVNISLDKRLANNWLGGFSYTWSRLEGNYSGLGSSDEFGRTSPYVERAFDNWAMSYDKNGNPIDGPLPTDRPHFFKLYGAYSFPFGLTIGMVTNAMSGVPFTERWYYLNVAYMYPFNRFYYRDEQGNLKRIRSPFLWFTNAYVVYNFKISEKIRVAVDLNVENLFNIATARSYYSLKMQSNMTVSEAMVLSKNWDLNTPGINYIPDPRFLMKQDFYPPISARLGFKLSF